MPLFRKCDLGLCPPYQEIFGEKYGVCPLIQECPENVVCGYALTKQIIETQTEKTSDALPR
jgi:hypothetical protein